MKLSVILVQVIFVLSCIVVFFFFKQKTAYEMRISDWSSDVCSSDLPGELAGRDDRPQVRLLLPGIADDETANGGRQPFQDGVEQGPVDIAAAESEADLARVTERPDR